MSESNQRHPDRKRWRNLCAVPRKSKHDSILYRDQYCHLSAMASYSKAVLRSTEPSPEFLFKVFHKKTSQAFAYFPKPPLFCWFFEQKRMFCFCLIFPKTERKVFGQEKKSRAIKFVSETSNVAESGLASRLKGADSPGSVAWIDKASK